MFLHRSSGNWILAVCSFTECWLPKMRVRLDEKYYLNILELKLISSQIDILESKLIKSQMVGSTSKFFSRHTVTTCFCFRLQIWTKPLNRFYLDHDLNCRFRFMNIVHGIEIETSTPLGVPFWYVGAACANAKIGRTWTQHKVFNCVTCLTTKCMHQNSSTTFPNYSWCTIQSRVSKLVICLGAHFCNYGRQRLDEHAHQRNALIGLNFSWTCFLHNLLCRVWAAEKEEKDNQ